MPRPISPMEMIPTVMARMVAGVYGRRRGNLRVVLRGRLGAYVKTKIWQSTQVVFSG